MVNSEIVTILIVDICAYTKTTTKLGRKEFDFFHEIFDRLSLPIFSKYHGKVIKKVGDGKGNVTNDIYDLSGGVFSKRVETTSNVEGNTDQSLAIYNIKFTNSPRSL